MTDQPAYRVLARKYRPAQFSQLIGQDVLVRTVQNAIRTSRIPQAFMLSGVRGVGKTTTARIISKALNCSQSNPETAEPCGECRNCNDIMLGTHVDVLELDAASRTGINDIRELIETTKYRPGVAQYKIYILDEVHMLSNSAFNGLLKILEEPPEHVIFIFATTEIRKVPLTILSRCQRHDLQRISIELLVTHFANISEKEGFKTEEAALRLIARAAEGSVRDGLSLLDQVMAVCIDNNISEDSVISMLGLSDRMRIYGLMRAIATGDANEAIALFHNIYDLGGNCEMLVGDLLELTHFLTRMRLVPDLQNNADIPEAERGQGMELAQAMRPSVLARYWQMLMKGLQEVKMAPVPKHACEMLLLRLIYAKDLPTPDDLVKRWESTKPQSSDATSQEKLAPSQDATPTVARQVDIAPTTQADTRINVTSFQDVLDVVSHERDGQLHSVLRTDVRLVKFDQGHIAIHIDETASIDVPSRLAKILSDYTNKRWLISLSDSNANPTLEEQEQSRSAARLARAERDPLVIQVRQNFPKCILLAVTPVKNDNERDNEQKQALS